MTTKRPWIVFSLFIVIFVTPVLLAWVLYFKNDSVGEGTVNYGMLIQPPLNLSKIPLQNFDGSPFAQNQVQGKWLLLYVEANRCDQNCQTMLYNIRQIRLATGKNMDRVQRAILTFTGGAAKDPQLAQLLQTDYSGTFHMLAKPKTLHALMADPTVSKLAFKPGYLYVVDPLGNIMMGYKPDSNPSKILKDLERLLKVSQIG